MAEDAFDAIALPVKAFAISDRFLTVGFWRNDGLDATLLQIGADGISIIGFIGQESPRLPLGQINQRFVGLAVRRFARCEVEGNGAASGITETMNFTGEPAPRAAKSSSMNPPFPPAAETWARIDVESML